MVQALIQQLLQCPNKAKEARDAKFFGDPASLVMDNHGNLQKWPWSTSWRITWGMVFNGIRIQIIKNMLSKYWKTLRPRDLWTLKGMILLKIIGPKIEWWEIFIILYWWNITIAVYHRGPISDTVLNRAIPTFVVHFHNWLVVWNMDVIFSIYLECHHPNWLIFIFFRWFQSTNQTNCDAVCPAWNNTFTISKAWHFQAAEEAYKVGCSGSREPWRVAWLIGS